VTSRESPDRPVPARADAERRLPAPATTERSAETVDALTRYMAELAHHAPIPQDEERALAVRWVEHGDVDAARQLVLANLRLVVKIAMEYRRAWTNALDLIQEGNVGLMEAVRRFDPYRGVKLSSYAVYWIRAYVLKYLLDNFRMVRLGSTRAERKLFFRLNREKRALEREGFEVGPKLLAERLDVTEDDIVSMEQRLSGGELSFDAPVGGEDDGRQLGDLLSHAAASAEKDVGDEELRSVFMEKVAAFAGGLSERDRRILEERVLADQPKTLQELGEVFGVSRERVRQLEARIVRELREYLKANLVDFEYYASPQD